MKTLKTNTDGYGYKYTDMSGIHSYLASVGASYYQYIETIDGNEYIMTVPTIDGVELKPRRGCRVVQATLSGKSNPAQEQGSALTYARRYSLLMAFGLATEDDDGESMSTYMAKRTPSSSVSPDKDVSRASESQRSTIEKLGGKFVDGMSVKEASELIGNLIREKNARNN